MAAPAPAPAPTQQPSSGPIDDKDVQEWSTRLNANLANVGETINSKSPETAEPWHSALFGCFNPIDTCLITCFVPCVTFGKTYHRIHKSPTLEGYEPINTSCLLLCGSGCVGLSFIPLWMQRAEIRQRYHLQGSCLTDLALTCCCGCCSVIQQDKEAAHREQNSGAVKQQYQQNSGMAYPSQ